MYEELAEKVKFYEQGFMALSGVAGMIQDRIADGTFRALTQMAKVGVACICAIDLET